MSGLFAQTTLFSSSSVAVAVATDMSEGVIDRFRTLPTARCAVLLGRTISTIIIGLPSLAVMITCALIVGRRPEAGLASAVAGFALLALFGFAMSWVGALTGMLARSPQAAGRAAGPGAASAPVSRPADLTQLTGGSGRRRGSRR